MKGRPSGNNDTERTDREEQVACSMAQTNETIRVFVRQQWAAEMPDLRSPSRFKQLKNEGIGAYTRRPVRAHVVRARQAKNWGP